MEPRGFTFTHQNNGFTTTSTEQTATFEMRKKGGGSLTSVPGEHYELLQLKITKEGLGDHSNSERGRRWP